MKESYIQTPLGFAKIIGDEKGVSQITVLNNSHSITLKTEAIHKECIQQIQEYFSGNRTTFQFKTHLIGTPFQQQVWQALQKIPYGKTISYLQLAKQIGNPKAIRAVANANAKNKLWIVVPCHRVIGSNGSLTGYAGGLHRKKWLLEHESPSIQKSLF